MQTRTCRLPELGVLGQPNRERRPTAGLDVTSTVPPCAVTIARTRLSPRPEAALGCGSGRRDRAVPRSAARSCGGDADAGIGDLETNGVALAAGR